MNDDYNTLPLGETFEESEYASIVPMASPDEQIALNDDIDKRGLIQPIWLYKGLIVDGRCRQKACIATNTRIKYRELSDTLDEDEVIAFVKSVNTRRNLTNTQKVISATKEYIRFKNSGRKITQPNQAKRWGISPRLLASGIYISKVKPSFIEPLFEGERVEIEDGSKIKKTSSISTIAKLLKVIEETTQQEVFDPASLIKTQSGIDWFYSRVKLLDSSKGEIMKDLVELANYKFNESESFNQDTGEIIVGGKVNEY